MHEPSAGSAPPRAAIRPYTGSIEIRVHGVSGTPPEELLGRSDVHQVAGDRVSGFYRPSLREQMRDEPSPDDPAATEDPDPAATGDPDPAATPEPGSPSSHPPRGPWLEGYSWGGWTSGARSRVLWLVLLPFALVNVSSRMLPPEPDGHRLARGLRLAAAALLRLLALSLTVTMVQGAAGVAMVTVALRCGTLPGRPGVCHGLPSFVTDLIGRLPTQGQVLLCAAVPLAVTGLLWLVSHHASARYENAPANPAEGRPDDAPQPLLRADLWQSGPVISRLRLLHVQAGVVSVAGTAAWLLPGDAARTMTLWLTAVAFGALAVLVVVRPSAPYTAARGGRIMLPARLAWILVAAVVGCLGWQVAPGLAGKGSGGPAGTGSGAATGGAGGSVSANLAVQHADVLVQDLFVGQAVLLAVLLVVVAIARLAGAGRGRALFVSGFAGFVIAMLAWLVAAMLTASILVLVPAWLARPGFAFTPRQIATALADPATSGWFGDTTRSSGVGTAVGLAVLVILLLQLGIRALVAARTGGARRDREAVRRDYPAHADANDATDRARARSIATMFWWARRVNGVPLGMAVLCAAVAVLLAVQGAALLSSSGAPSGWQATVLGRIPPACRAAATTGLCSHVGLVAWGVFCTAGLGVLVLIVGVLAYRTRAARRGVGVFWDLACFWPRDTHPLAPPCYNERIMPQVSVRVAWYLGTDERAGAADPDSGTDPDSAADRETAGDPDPDVTSAGRAPGGVSVGAPVHIPVDGDPGPRPDPDRRGRLVLAGHSQGSVIALAAALIQPEAARRRLALITVGCVLDRLYSRFFPRYFGPEIYALAAGMLTAADEDEEPSGGSVAAARWTNIWRHSDYLGGSVPYPPATATAQHNVPGAGSPGRGSTGWPSLSPQSTARRSSGAQCAGRPNSGPQNVESIDPVFAPPPGDTVDPAAGRHSDFWTDPAFLPAVDRMLRLVGTGRAGTDVTAGQGAAGPSVGVRGAAAPAAPPGSVTPTAGL